jgi:hypothetical protein
MGFYGAAVMAPRGIGLLALLCLAVIPHCGGCAPVESSTPRKIDSAENQIPQSSAPSDHFRTLKIRGMLKNHEGQPLTGVVGVLFAIYEHQKDGAPLWQEVQNVEVDTRGHFTALVGSTTSEEIPAYLFSGEQIRWLGEQVMLPGEVEQPRIQVVSAAEGLRADQPLRLGVLGELGEQPAPADAVQSSSDAPDPQLSSPQDPTGQDSRAARAGRGFGWPRRPQ